MEPIENWEEATWSLLRSSPLLSEDDSATPSTLLRNVLIPNNPNNDDDGEHGGGYYRRGDLLLADGRIERIAPPNSLRVEDASSSCEVIQCDDLMVLPGFVNAHTHSVEHWARGLIAPLPLELWVTALRRHEPRGVPHGWYGADSYERTPSAAIALSALLAGVESLLSGCTVVCDHLYVRQDEGHDDLRAALTAYRALGIRSFVAPMLGDDAVFCSNYVPLCRDAEERNERLAMAGKRNGGGDDDDDGCPACRRFPGGGSNPDGTFRTKPGAYDPKKTKECLELWERAVDDHHDPERGVEIVVGPVTAYSCSPELLRGAAELRRRRDLRGHTHLLETRAQALMARQYFPESGGSAVRHLIDAGFLAPDLRGTSLAHAVWLTDEELELVRDNNGVCVHNPLSNLRLGSGVAPTLRSDRVALGCDGACSSDGQDMLEVLKTATTLTTLTTPDYRDWISPREVALDWACRNGYAAVGLDGRNGGGVLREGALADVTLWDTTSLALLPRTDPLSLLVVGSRTQAPGAGSTLRAAWVRGRKVVDNGSPSGVDLRALRRVLVAAQPRRRDGSVTDPSSPEGNEDGLVAAHEREYRAAVGLDDDDLAPDHADPETFPADRVLYDVSIPRRRRRRTNDDDDDDSAASVVSQQRPQQGSRS